MHIINKFERKVSWKGAVTAGKRFTLFIPNKNINDIMKTEKSLEDSGVSIDGLTETVKHKKTQESRFLGALLVPLAASLMQPVISLVVKGMGRRGVRRAERWYMDENF